MDTPIKKSLFGYSKSSVNLYVKEMNESASRMLEEKNAEIKALKDECAKLREQKDAITEAILAAKKRAQEIISTSEKEAEQKRERLRSDYTRETENIDRIRSRISDIRSAATETLKSFNENLKDIETSLQNERRAAEPLSDGIFANEASEPFEKPAAPSAEETAPAESREKVAKPTIIKIK